MHFLVAKEGVFALSSLSYCDKQFLFYFFYFFYQISLFLIKNAAFLHLF